MTDHFTQHLRLTLLRMMLSAPAYRANSSIMHTIAEDFGLAASRDRIKTELAWLAEQGLTKNEDMGGIVVATLTERGLDAAEARTSVPGVQRPGPRS